FGLGRQGVLSIEGRTRAGHFLSTVLDEVFFSGHTSAFDRSSYVVSAPLAVGFCIQRNQLLKLASQVIFLNEPGVIRHFQHSKGDKSELANGQLVYVVRATSKRR